MSTPAKVVSPVHSGRVSGLTHDGLGVVNHDGSPVFLDGALPGEDVTFRIAKKKRRYSVGVLEEIVNKSPDRAEPLCPHFGVCGGCRLQQLEPGAQLTVKTGRLVETLKRLGRVEPETVLEPVTGEPWNYRRRARLSARWVQKKDKTVVGFRERKASFVTDTSECAILCEPFATMIPALSELATRLSIRARLPQIELSAGDTANALVFRSLEPLTADDERLLADFGVQHGVDIWVQPGAPETAAPLGASRPLTYALPEHDVVIGFGPLDFVQVNATANRQLVSRAIELLDPQPDDHVLDLFSGLGNFSLPLARHAGRVTGVEGDASLVARARQNAEMNGIENADFETDDLFSDRADGSWRKSRYARMLLDPPRAGARLLVENVDVLGVSRIVYVSCDPATLARDAGTLVSGHGYRLSAAGIVDMFTHTAHVESIAVFDRDS